MAATEPIRNKSQLKALANYFLKRGQFRNYALIAVGTCTALRISDLLKLKWTDVYDEKQRVFHTHVTIVEMKTGIAFSQAVFAFERMLTAEERNAVAGVSDTVKAYAANLTPASLIDDEPPVDPETGEIIEPLK